MNHLEKFKNENPDVIIVDMSLNNDKLYKGLDVESVAGRLNVKSTPAQGVEIVGNNIEKMALSGDKVLLTGAMAVWSYLPVFHSVVHKFRQVYYFDGRNDVCLIAAHG